MWGRGGVRETIYIVTPKPLLPPLQGGDLHTQGRATEGHSRLTRENPGQVQFFTTPG